RFSWMVLIAMPSMSISVAWAAPRLSASIATLPVPENKSRKAESTISWPIRLNNASLTRSRIGRVLSPGTRLRCRPLAEPAITRIGILVSRLHCLTDGAKIGQRRRHHRHAAGRDDQAAAVGLLD